MIVRTFAAIVSRLPYVAITEGPVPRAGRGPGGLMHTRNRTATATVVAAVLLIASGPAAAATDSSGTDVATILRHTKAFTDTQHSDPATSRSEVATVNAG